MLFNACACHFNRSWLFLSINMNINNSCNEIRLICSQSYPYSSDFFWFNAKTAGLNFNSSPLGLVYFKTHSSRDSSFIFEFNFLVLSSFDRHESKVDKGFKLHIRCWLQGMQEKLEFLVMTFRLNFNNIVKVTFMVCFKRYVHLDCKTSCQWTLHIMLNLELGCLWTCEFQSPDSLAYISNCNCHFVVLVWLNIYSLKGLTYNYKTGSYIIKRM